MADTRYSCVLGAYDSFLFNDKQAGVVMKISHGKIPRWYDKNSLFEEVFNENTASSKQTNHTIEKILKKYNCKTVLDLTCGTGSQVFWLTKKKFKVVGSDVSLGMLKIAKQKSKKMPVKLLHGDMRTIKVGKFDAAITIFNSIGHLTKNDFEKTMQNISSNLNRNGIYIFDILNLNYVRHADNITKMSLEKIRRNGNATLREIQHSVINPDGILISHTIFYVQSHSSKIKESKTTITLQLYTAKELREMLARNGFKVLSQCGIDGSKFSDKKTERIVTVAQKLM